MHAIHTSLCFVWIWIYIHYVFSVLCEWMPSFSRAKPISPELWCSCCHHAGHHARGCLHFSARVCGSLATDNGVTSGHWHQQWLLPSKGRCIMISPFTNQTHYCCIDFTLICIQIVHNKHCTSALTSHLSCCLSLNWIRRKYHEENKNYIK